MKFSFKIVIGTMLIVVIMFSLSGILLIHENFKSSFQLQVDTDIEEHNVEKYSIENNINENIMDDGSLDRIKLESYLYTLTSYLTYSRKLMIDVNDETIWNNVPFDIDKEKLKSGDYITSNESKKYFVISSQIFINEETIWITSVYDITGVFEVRNNNLRVFYIIDIILLTLCGCFTTLFARLLTKPIKELNDVTKAMAGGELDTQIAITSDDEIGELAKSFQVMVESIKEKISELELSVKQREDFVANFTHELKTPMTSIMGYSKILKQDLYSKADKEKALDYIHSETKRLDILSHKLLDLMELSQGHIHLHEIDAPHLFQTLQELADQRLDPIHLTVQAEACTILGDEDLLITCIMNLLENVQKASEPEAEIRLSGCLRKDHYRIDVVDHGKGMELAEIKRITESFYRIDRSRSKSQGGYGIGLSICSKIARLHHSELTFISEIGKGTTVSLELEVIKSETK